MLQQERFMVLTPDSLKYYKTESDFQNGQPSKGFIKIKNIYDIYSKEKMPGKYELVLKVSGWTKRDKEN